MPYDHTNASAGSFLNRYFINDQFYKHGSPVFVYDVGEDSAELVLQKLFDDGHYLHQLISEFNGLGIIWEHRFYGNSSTNVIDSVYSPNTADYMQYLTFENALGDIPYFARQFNRSNIDYDLTPGHTPWIMLGGSYAGARTAYTRQLYPDVIYAGYASSAPVQFQVDFSGYYESIWQTMVALGHENCANDIHAALSYIDGQLQAGNTALDMKKMFLGNRISSKKSNADFAYDLTLIFSGFQSYGFSPNGFLGPFCEYLETDPQTNETAGPNGLAATYGNSMVARRWATAPSWASNLQALPPGNVDPILTNSQIAYNWQTCSELGYFEAVNQGPHSLISGFLTLEDYQESCYSYYPQEFAGGYLPMAPTAAALVSKLGGWNIRPSNLFWTAGEFDPWALLSPMSTSPDAPHVNVNPDIPTCNGGTNIGELFGYLLEGDLHGYDLSDFNDGEAVKARAIFTNALAEWLGCFIPK